MAAHYRIVRPTQMSPAATRARTGASSAPRVDRNELVACIAFGLLLAVTCWYSGCLLLSVPPRAVRCASLPSGGPR